MTTGQVERWVSFSPQFGQTVNKFIVFYQFLFLFFFFSSRDTEVWGYGTACPGTRPEGSTNQICSYLPLVINHYIFHFFVCLLNVFLTISCMYMVYCLLNPTLLCLSPTPVIPYPSPGSFPTFMTFCLVLLPSEFKQGLLCVPVGLELSIGPWWTHDGYTTEDNDLSSRRTYQ